MAQRLLARIGPMLCGVCLSFATAGSSLPTTAAVSPTPLVLETAALTKTAVEQLFNGRLLDLQQGFVFFSTGDTFRLSTHARITSLETQMPITMDDFTGSYARAHFSHDGVITALEISQKPLPLDSVGNLQRFIVQKSTPYSNPDLTNHEGFTGLPVLVSFTVAVPPNTSITDKVYISTAASNWDPFETRMDRIDALHYRITRHLNSGTHVVYRYTRGSWRSAERGRDGLEGAARTFIVQNLDIARRDDTVFHWSDENVGGGSVELGPDAIPTPFNGNPFPPRQ